MATSGSSSARSLTNERHEPTLIVSKSTFVWTTAALVLVALSFVLRRVWVADDAFITFRHVANFWSGYGPVFNPGERVQGYSHPLWFLLLTAGASAFDVYAIAVGLGLSLTCALFIIQSRRLRNDAHGLIRLQFIALLLLSSKTFVEFQTSGLESSLVTLLVTWLWAMLVPSLEQDVGNRRYSLTSVAWLCGLMILTRLDLVILLSPIVFYVFVIPVLRWLRGGRKSAEARRSWLGPSSAWLPVVAWYGFATIYYGTPLPNTAYAKVVMPFPRAFYVGADYLVDYSVAEPIHALVMLAAVILGLIIGIRDWRHGRSGVAAWLALGIACHVVYVMSVGGDFMRGRFLDAPMVASVVLAAWILGRLLPARGLSPRALAASIGIFGLVFLAIQVGYPRVILSAGRGADDLFYSIIRWPVGMCLGIVVYVVGVAYLGKQIVRSDGRRASVFFGVLVSMDFVLLAAIAGWYEPPWVLIGVLAMAGLCVAMMFVKWLAGAGLRHASAGMAACLIIAGAISMCDLSRPMESMGTIIADEYTYYRIPGWHNPFRYATESMWGYARIWMRFGEATHRYAEKFGPITVAYGALGNMSYYAGPKVQVIDVCGLTEPYVARSVTPRYGRTGHVHFQIPAGYLEERGAINCLPNWVERIEKMDPTLAEDARKLAANATWASAEDEKRWRETQLIISGPLFSRERLALLPRYIFHRRIYTDEPTHWEQILRGS